MLHHNHEPSYLHIHLLYESAEFSACKTHQAGCNLLFYIVSYYLAQDVLFPWHYTKLEIRPQD